VNIKFDYMT